MMDVRTFRAATMPEALALVKRELGGDAIILGTRALPAPGIGGLVGRERVEITAAPASAAAHAAAAGPAATARRSAPRWAASPAAAAPAAQTARTSTRPASPAERPADPAGSERRGPSMRRAAAEPAKAASGEPPRTVTCVPSLPQHVQPWFVKLVQQEVGESLAVAIAEAVAEEIGPGGSAEQARESFRRQLVKLIPVAGGIELTAGRTRRVALVGPAGSGKTTTITKLAAHFHLRMRKRVAILSLDMHRLATHDQIRRFGDLVAIPVFTAQTVSAVKQILRSQNDLDLLLIDSHGVGPNDRGAFVRLAALLRACRPDETHVVLPASMSGLVQRRMLGTFERLGASHLVLSRLDEALGCGAFLNAVHSLKVGVSYTTDGQRVPTDLQEACPQRLAQLYLE